MANVLVVESNRMVRTMYVAGLSGYGYRVMEAPTVRDARAALESGVNPAVILVDMTLPDGQGTELIHFVRAELGMTNVKIILTSGGAPVDGADAQLQKPVELVKLLNTVRACA